MINARGFRSAIVIILRPPYHVFLLILDSRRRAGPEHIMLLVNQTIRSINILIEQDMSHADLKKTTITCVNERWCRQPTRSAFAADEFG